MPAPLSPAPLPPYGFSKKKGAPVRIVQVTIDGVRYIPDPALCMKPAEIEDRGSVRFCGLTLYHVGRCEPWLRLRRLR